MEHFQSSWEGKSNDVNHVIIQTWLQFYKREKGWIGGGYFGRTLIMTSLIWHLWRVMYTTGKITASLTVGHKFDHQHLRAHFSKSIIWERIVELSCLVTNQIKTIKYRKYLCSALLSSSLQKPSKYISHWKDIFNQMKHCVNKTSSGWRRLNNSSITDLEPLKQRYCYLSPRSTPRLMSCSHK